MKIAEIGAGRPARPTRGKVLFLTIQPYSRLNAAFMELPRRMRFNALGSSVKALGPSPRTVPSHHVTIARTHFAPKRW